MATLVCLLRLTLCEDPMRMLSLSARCPTWRGYLIFAHLSWILEEMPFIIPLLFLVQPRLSGFMNELSHRKFNYISFYCCCCLWNCRTKKTEVNLRDHWWTQYVTTCSYWGQNTESSLKLLFTYISYLSICIEFSALHRQFSMRSTDEGLPMDINCYSTIQRHPFS